MKRPISGNSPIKSEQSGLEGSADGGSLARSSSGRRSSASRRARRRAPSSAVSLDIAPSVIRNWKRHYEAGASTAVAASEEVVPASQLREADARTRELERALRGKTVEFEILRAAQGNNKMGMGRGPTHLRSLIAPEGCQWPPAGTLSPGGRAVLRPRGRTKPSRHKAER